MRIPNFYSKQHQRGIVSIHQEQFSKICGASTEGEESPATWLVDNVSLGTHKPRTTYPKQRVCTHFFRTLTFDGPWRKAQSTGMADSRRCQGGLKIGERV